MKDPRFNAEIRDCDRINEIEQQRIATANGHLDAGEPWEDVYDDPIDHYGPDIENLSIRSWD